MEANLHTKKKSPLRISKTKLKKKKTGKKKGQSFFLMSFVEKKVLLKKCGELEKGP